MALVPVGTKRGPSDVLVPAAKAARLEHTGVNADHCMQVQSAWAMIQSAFADAFHMEPRSDTQAIRLNDPVRCETFPAILAVLQSFL